MGEMQMAEISIATLPTSENHHKPKAPLLKGKLTTNASKNRANVAA
jgi:hypothetical protein